MKNVLLNGNGTLNGNGNSLHSGPDRRWQKQLARDRTIKLLSKVVQILLIVSISGFAIYGFWTGVHRPAEPAQPDAIDLIESHIDGIDLNKPQAEVRKYLNTIKSELDKLRPEPPPDESNRYGGA